MGKLFHRLLYRLLSLEGYLRVVSRLFFLTRALGIGRNGRALEYNYHLPNLVSRGAMAIDIGANLGYYTRPLADIVGAEGRVYAVEPVPVIFDVLKRNVAGRKNVTLLNYALGEDERTIEMANDSVAAAGYFGTGRNFVSDGELSGEAIRFTAQRIDPQFCSTIRFSPSMMQGSSMHSFICARSVGIRRFCISPVRVQGLRINKASLRFQYGALGKLLSYIKGARALIRLRGRKER